MSTDATPDTLKVDPGLEEEFERAIAFQLTDEDIERSRLLIGIDTAIPAPRAVLRGDAGCPPELGARASGDDNPLYTDEDYGDDHAVGFADRSRHDGGSREDADARRPDPGRDQRSRPRASSAGSTCSCPAARGTGTGRCMPGDRIYSFAGEESVEVKASEFAGRSVIQRAPRRRDQPARRGRRRVPHPARAHRAQDGARAGKYAEIEAGHTTPTRTTSRIDAIYEQERPRGAEKRYWEDVEVGDAAAADGEGPAHRDGDHRVPRRRLRVRALRPAVVAGRLQEPEADRALLHQERARHLRTSPSDCTGTPSWAKAHRQPDGVRLRGAAPVLVLPPRVGLGGRRRLHRAARGLDPQVQLHGRHAVPDRGGGRQARRGRPPPRRPRAAHGQPARHRDRLRRRRPWRCPPARPGCHAATASRSSSNRRPSRCSPATTNWLRNCAARARSASARSAGTGSRRRRRSRAADATRRGRHRDRGRPVRNRPRPPAARPSGRTRRSARARASSAGERRTAFGHEHLPGQAATIRFGRSTCPCSPPADLRHAGGNRARVLGEDQRRAARLEQLRVAADVGNIGDHVDLEVGRAGHVVVLGDDRAEPDDHTVGIVA